MPTDAVGVAVPVEEVRAVLPQVRTGGYLLATGPGGTALLPDPPRLRLGRTGERRTRRFARDLAAVLAAPVWHLLDRPDGTRVTLVTPGGAAATLDWPPEAAVRRADGGRADWERRCARLATMAGRPERGAALAGLLDGPAADGGRPGDERPSGERLLAELCELFGLPGQLVGQSLVSRAAPHGRGAVRFEGWR